MTATVPLRLLTTKQVAELASVCTRTVERWREQGLIKAVSPSRGIIRYTEQDVAEFIEKLRAQA